jgi:TP901 family phage tail tape measure protein
MANDLELELKVQADTDKAQENLNQTSSGVEDVGVKAEKTNSVFYTFVTSATLGMVGLAKSIAGTAASLYSFAQETLGLTVKLDTSNIGLKAAGFAIQNLRKEFTLSLGFLKTFADYLDRVNFPIPAVEKFINLMAKFNVVIGIGKGDTVFQNLKEDAVKLGEVVKKISLKEFKEEIASAARSLVLFAANTTATFTSLKKNIASESAFSEASRTINATDEQLKTLKSTIDEMATVDLALPTDQLYAIAKAAGSAGKSAQDIPQFVRTVAEGVVALGIPAEELANKLGTVQSLLHLSEEQLVSFSDQVNTTADTLSNVSEVDIFEVMSTGAASAGQQFGLLKGETIALSGTMVSLGAAPEVARTGIINLLNSLQNAKNQTPEFQQALAMMGTSADKLAVDIKDKPMPTLLALLDTMNGFSKAGRLDIADKLLGKGQDSVALTKLVDNTQLLKQAINQTSDATLYSGSVHDAYLKKLATEDSGLQLVSNAWNRLSISLTETFLPAVKLITAGFSKFLNVLTEFSLNHPIIKTFAAVATTVLSLGGAFRVLGLAMSLVGLSPAGLIAKFSQLGATLIALNANVMATTASLFAMARGSSSFGILKTAMSFLFGGTIGIAVGAISLIAIGIANLLPVTTKWGETSATVGEIISAMWKTIVDGFKPMTDIFSAGITALDDWLESLGIADGIVGVLKNSLEFIGVVVVNTGGLFKAFGQTIGVVIGSAVEGIAAFSDFVDDVFSGKGIGDSLNTYLDRVKGNIASVSESFKQVGTDAGNAVKDFEEGVSKNLQKDPKKLATKDTRTPDIGTDLAPTDDAQTAKEKAAEREKLAKEAEDRIMKSIIDNEAEKIRLYTNTAATQKQIDDFTFQQKLITSQQITGLINARLDEELSSMEKTKQKSTEAFNQDIMLSALELQLKTANADKDYELVVNTTQKIAERKRALTTETYQLTQEELQAKRTALIEIESATVQQIKNLTALEQEHRNKAIAFVKEIEATELQRLNNNRALDDLGLTNEELAENKKRQLVADTAKIKDLIKTGEYEKAAELGKKTQELAFEAAKQARENDIKANQMSEASRQARENYNKVVSLTTVALNGASKAEIAQAEIAKAEADKRKLTLDQVRGKILEIEEATKNGVQLKVTANTKEVDDAKTRLQQPTSSVHTIHQQIVNDAPAHATGGLIKGKGTGTSDEIPAMLSNGEYVIKADVVAKHGVSAFDAINYGGVQPQNYYATGGVVGDDKLKQKADELKKAAYQQAVAVFDDPKNQIIWRMDTGQTSTGSADPNSQQKNFENKVGEYLRRNGLPMEWREMYLSGVKANQVLRTTKASFMEKAKAQLELDNQFATPEARTTIPTPEAPRISRVAPPVLPSPSSTSFPTVAPPSFTPVISHSNAGMPGSSGKVSTVKFELPDGKSTIGHSTDPNFEKFFEQMNTVGGVTKV